MKSLPNDLKHLDTCISWNKIKQIKGRTFEFLTKLKFLDLSYCNTQDVDKGVFGELINLQYLNHSYNRELGFASLPDIAFALNQTKILSLFIDAMDCATGTGTYIKKHHLEGNRTTHLRKMSLAKNRLKLFERGVIYILPKNLMFFFQYQGTR